MSTRHITHIPVLRDEGGQDLIEYALLTALIALVASVAVTAVGDAVATSFWSVIAAAIPK